MASDEGEEMQLVSDSRDDHIGAVAVQHANNKRSLYTDAEIENVLLPRIVRLQTNVYINDKGRPHQLLERLRIMYTNYISSFAIRCEGESYKIFEGLINKMRVDPGLTNDTKELATILTKMKDYNTDCDSTAIFLKSLHDAVTNEKRKKGIVVFLILSFSLVLSTIAASSNNNLLGAYGLQVICNGSKAIAWMFNNVLRTRFNIDFGNSVLGLTKTFFFTAFPFVIPEYYFNFASMYRARAANITLPYLLNFGLAVDKFVQYLLAWLSGEVPSVGDWVAFAGIIVSVGIGAVVDDIRAR